MSKIIDAIPFPFFVIDVTDYSIQIANQATHCDFTLNKTLHCYEVTHQRQQPCSFFGDICPVDEIRNSGTPITVEHIHMENDEKRNIRVFAYPLFDESGQVTQVLELQIDFTAQKMAENRLIKSEQRYRALSMATFEGILLNKEGIIIDANEIAEQMLAAPVSELIGQNFSHFLPVEKQPAYAKIMQSHENRHFRTELVKADGSTLQVDIQHKLLSEKNQTVQVTAIRDTSYEDRVEKELQAQQAILLDAFSQAPVGIAIVKQEGQFYFWNSAFEKLTGYTHKKIEQLVFADLIHKKELQTYQNTFQKLIQRIWKSVKIDTKLVTKNGDILDIKLQTVRIGKDENTMFVFFLQDITALLELENRQKRLARKIEPLYNELENFTELIKEEVDYVYDSTDYGLSERDNTIIGLIVCGNTNREIAERMNLAEITIKKHVSAIYKAFNVRKRIDLINTISRSRSKQGISPA